MQTQLQLSEGDRGIPSELLEVQEDGFNILQRRAVRHMLEKSHLHFTRYFFKHREGTRFIVSQHHKIICDVLDRVFSGEITRLIINIPPGYAKTELVVIEFIAHGFALNPRSKFIHVSYSDTLVQNNSASIQDIIKSDEYKAFWPDVKIKTDSQSKKDWHTHLGGGMLAVSSGGTITGFRAGRLMDGFTGALVVDDPMKPDDAFHQVIRDKVNLRFNNTYKSRPMHERVPIVVIMQRLHEEDTTGYLLRGGTGEKWHHLLLEVDTEYPLKVYPKEYSHAIPILYSEKGGKGLYKLPRGPLWVEKHNSEDIEVLRNSEPYTFASQYQQRPAPLGGGIFKSRWWKFYQKLPQIEYRIITADTAQKTEEWNDYSVFQCWGYSGGYIYLEDMIRGKWEADELRMQAIMFWNKHIGRGDSRTTGHLRAFYVEDKTSGTGLIQDIRNDPKLSIPILPIERSNDKVTRAMDCVPSIASGFVWLPESQPWVSEFLAEFAKFTPLLSHKHDDQIDACLDAIDILIRESDYVADAW